MADFFIRRPIVAMVIAILTVIVGLISLKRLPISEYPPVSPTMIQVTTTYRGAAAEAVMESVATPIESKVNGVDKLLYMQSFNANDGKLTLNVYFDVGTDVDIMQVNTQNRVSQAEAQLPAAVKQEGVVVNRSSPDILMVVALNSPSNTYDAIFLGNYCDINLVDAIKRVRGVGDVKNFTAQDYTMRVWLRPDKLASLGITPQRHPERPQGAERPVARRPHRRRTRSAGAGNAVQRPRARPAQGSQGVRGNHHPLQSRRLAGEDQGRGPRGTGRADLRIARPLEQVAGRRHRHLTSPREPTPSRRRTTCRRSSRTPRPSSRRTWLTMSRSTRPCRSRPRWRKSSTRCSRRSCWCSSWSISFCKASAPRSSRCVRCRCRCWARSSCSRCWASA